MKVKKHSRSTFKTLCIPYWKPIIRNKYRISIQQESNNTGRSDISCCSVMTPQRWHLLLWSSLNRHLGSWVRGLICGGFLLFCSSRLASAFFLDSHEWNILFSSQAWHGATLPFFGRQDWSADFDSDNPDGWFLAVAALICAADFLANLKRSDLLLSWSVCHSRGLKRQDGCHFKTRNQSWLNKMNWSACIWTHPNIGQHVRKRPIFTPETR